MIPKLTSFILFLLYFVNVNAQKATQSTYITSIKYHDGILIPHHKGISEIKEESIRAVEINVGLIPKSERRWAQIYNQTEVGLGLYQGSLGNDKVLGQVTALFPYINFHILRSRKINLINHFGVGLGLNNRKFHPSNNKTNIAIGTDLNTFFIMSFDLEFALNTRWQLTGGVGMNHLSNGAMKLPNKGLNILTGNLALKYALSDRPKNSYFNKIHRFKKLENEISLAWNHGSKQVYKDNPRSYYTSSISSYYALGISPKQHLGLGLDLFYDTSSLQETSSRHIKTKFEDRFRQALFIASDWYIDKFVILTHVGIYTLFKTKAEKPIYGRIGFRYNIGQNLFTNINLKVHWASADFIEFGFGYRIQIRKKHDIN